MFSSKTSQFAAKSKITLAFCVIGRYPWGLNQPQEYGIMAQQKGFSLIEVLVSLLLATGLLLSLLQQQLQSKEILLQLISHLYDAQKRSHLDEGIHTDIPTMLKLPIPYHGSLKNEIIPAS